MVSEAVSPYRSFAGPVRENGHMDGTTCANCGRALAPTEDGYTHVPESFALDCAGPAPAKADDLIGFLRARTVEQLRTGNWLGADYKGAPERRQTGINLIRDALAKRQIVDEHGPHERYQDECATCGCPDSCGCAGGVDFPCDTLRLLASVYADHPDYRAEWRP